MSAKLRLMYSSNLIGTASGYGVQGASLLPRLAELPEFGGEVGSEEGRTNIAHHAWYGLHGSTMNYKGFQVYPAFDDPYGNDVVGAHVKHFGANVLVSLIDVWVMQQTAEKIAPALWLPWLPIDHDPVPFQVINSLKGAHLPLTYSKWGHKMLSEAGVENEYIPHGIETGIYKVNPDVEEVARFKKWLTGDEACHLSVIVAANKGFPDCKWFQGQLECWRMFALPKIKQGVNCKLYIHSLPTPVHGGVDFNLLVSAMGLVGHVIFPQPYLYRLGYPAEHMAFVYNAADVLLAVACSEGFGIPIIEAQACGTPVITTNFSAMPELVRWGHLVDVADKILTGMHSYQAWPSKASMLDKMERLYDAWEASGGVWPMTKCIATQDAIHSEYNWDTIVRDQWSPLMERIAAAAPPLDAKHAVTATTAFVSALQEAVRKDVPVVPRQTVEPLGKIHVGEASKQEMLQAANLADGYEAITVDGQLI